jgi:hypothetical protein
MGKKSLSARKLSSVLEQLVQTILETPFLGESKELYVFLKRCKMILIV